MSALPRVRPDDGNDGGTILPLAFSLKDAGFPCVGGGTFAGRTEAVNVPEPGAGTGRALVMICANK